MTRFNDCLAFTIGPSIEGGISNYSADRGGLTNYGITQITYDRYRIAQGLPQQPASMATIPEAQAIYLTYYWTPAQCGAMPAPVDLCMFDMTVNSGLGNASKNLQRALGVVVDGVIGPATLAAVAAGDPMSTAASFIDLRDAFYKQIVVNDPSQGIFLNGWLNRDNALRTACGLPVS